MNKNFESLKRKTLISVILKSVAAGLSAGLVSVGIVLLAVTLSGNVLHWAYYILIGVVLTAAVGAAVFFIMRPTDLKVAKLYDKEFALEERLQTMVEFAGVDSEMTDLQRRDAAEKLSLAPKTKFKLSRVWQYAVSAGLALCIFASGVAVTAVAYAAGDDNPWGKGDIDPDDGKDEDEDAFEYDLFKEAGLSELMENVRESALADKEKTAIVGRLFALGVELADVTSKQIMKNIVAAAVLDIDEIINSANSFRKICEGIGDSDEKLRTAIIDSVLVYRSSTTPLNTAERVKQFRNRINDGIEIALEISLSESFAALKVKQVSDSTDEATLAETLAEYISDLTKAVEYYQNSITVQYDGEQIAENDLLATALQSFIGELGSVPVDRGYTDNAVWGTDNSGNPIDTAPKNIRKAYDNLAVNLTTALFGQCYNCAMDTFVRLRLCEIFGIGTKELPAFNGDLTESGNQGGGEGGEDDPNGGSGGIGTGDTNYSGNDKIYDIDFVGKNPDADPNEDGYVHYGDVLDKYQAIMYGKLDNMQVSDELRKIIENYFKNLYYKGEDDNNNGQNEN